LLTDVLSGPVLVGTGSRFRYSKTPTTRVGGPRQPEPNAPNPVAVAAPTAGVVHNRVRNRVRNRAVHNRAVHNRGVHNRLGPRSSCRPSHGSRSSSGKGPNPGPMGRPGTSDDDMWAQEKALPGQRPWPVRVWTKPRRQPPARQRTGEATVFFACRNSFPKDSP
jgi:hypothetical protein